MFDAKDNVSEGQGTPSVDPQLKGVGDYSDFTSANQAYRSVDPSNRADQSRVVGAAAYSRDNYAAVKHASTSAYEAVDPKAAKKDAKRAAKQAKKDEKLAAKQAKKNAKKGISSAEPLEGEYGQAYARVAPLDPSKAGAVDAEPQEYGATSQYLQNMQGDAYLASHKAARKKKKRRRVAMIALAVVGVLLLGGAGAAFAYMQSLNASLQEGVDDDLLNSLTVSDSPSNPFYMLLIGVDKSQDREEGGVFDGSWRTDSMILTRIDPQNKKVTMISIHRDTQVTIPGYGQQKINAAYTFGGPAGAVKAVSDLAGVPISHYAEIDFDAFEEVVDQLGGVEVDVPYEINDDRAGGHVDAGQQVLSGEEALILCRSRHTYDKYATDGDRMRAANQRMVLTAIMKKLMASDIGTLTNTVSTLAKYITTDMDVATLVGLAQTMNGMDVSQDLYTAMEPTTSKYVNDTWWEEVDQTAWMEMMRRVDQGLSPTEEDVVDQATGVTVATAGDGGKASSSSSSDSASSDSSSVTFDFSGKTIAVRNGSTIDGAAGDAAGKLTSLDAEIDVGNANNKNFATTLVIYHDDANADGAQVIANTLGQGQVRKNDGSYLTKGDFLVIIGSDCN